MDKNEAKLILSNYTLGDTPAKDDRFDQALALTDSDPELASWWQRQKEGDAMVRDKLGAFDVPSDLRSALHETLSAGERRRRRISRLKTVFALAAGFTIAFLAYFQYGIDRSDNYKGPLAERAYQYSVDGPRLTYFDRDTQKLKDWLVANAFDLPDQLPPRLLELEGIGCRPLKWSTDRVALMCFNAETVYHLFIGYEKDFPNFNAPEEYAFEPKGDGWTVSKWKDKEFVLVLTAKTPVSVMSSYLSSYHPQ